VQQYVAELEHRSQLQGQLADERAAKEHAMYLQHSTENRNVQLQVWSHFTVLGRCSVCTSETLTSSVFIFFVLYERESVMHQTTQACAE
jgi:hypothetical protein